MSKKLYGERDAESLDEAGNFYLQHVMAMTAENLHSKSDIAAELGFRDMQIAALQDERDAFACAVNELQKAIIEYDDCDTASQSRQAMRQMLFVAKLTPKLCLATNDAEVAKTAFIAGATHDFSGDLDFDIALPETAEKYAAQLRAKAKQ